MVNTYYSKLNRQSGYDASIFMVEAEDEKINILKSLGNDNPFLTQKLKRYLINQNNCLLQNILNSTHAERIFLDHRQWELLLQRAMLISDSKANL